ncbi:MAG: sulfotransferase [Chloroflexi bacterium]|nr:sulfotransferase [Chloroflexota bacterium]
MVVLISGHQRSGTTMLRRLCDAHPQMRFTNEFSCFSDVGENYSRSLFNRLAQWRLVNGRWAYNSDYVNSPRRHWHNLSFTVAYMKRLAAYDKRNITITAVANSLSQTFPDAQVVGDKWPQYMPLLPNLMTSKLVRVIVIYRDCRDVTSSFLEKVRTEWRSRPWAGEVDTAAKIARNWVEKIELMESLSDQIYIIRYEELVRQPQFVLAALGKWLGVAPDDFLQVQSVKTTSIGKYSQGLMQSELDDVLAIAGTTMARLNYI